MTITSQHQRVGKAWLAMKIAAGAMVAGLALLSHAAGAHGIWFAQRARQLALIYGVGADDLDAVKRLPMIAAVKGFDAHGLPVGVALRPAGPIPVVESDAPLTIVAAAMDYGLWTRTSDGEWHNKGRDEMPKAAMAEHNWKYAVHLTQMPTGPVPLIEGHTLQLVPVGAIAQKMGAPITLRALYKGKPVAGATIMADYVNDPDEVGVKTRADGTATIRLRNQGMNVIMAIYVGPADDPTKADHSEYRSSLSFVLPHAPE
jgi:nickel transport protein